jgi:hypothetical protein
MLNTPSGVPLPTLMDIGLLPDFLHPGDKKGPLWQGEGWIGKWPYHRSGNPPRVTPFDLLPLPGGTGTEFALLCLAITIISGRSPTS